MEAVYIAHPLGNGDEREDNRNNATDWCCGVALAFLVLPMAQWVIQSARWDENRRNLGMRLDFEQIRRCDEVWLCGGRISPGMAEEKAFAISIGKPVLDLTSCGYRFPLPGDPLWARMIELQRSAVRL